MFLDYIQVWRSLTTNFTLSSLCWLWTDYWKLSRPIWRIHTLPLIRLVFLWTNNKFWKSGKFFFPRIYFLMQGVCNFPQLLVSFESLTYFNFLSVNFKIRDLCLLIILIRHWLIFQMLIPVSWSDTPPFLTQLVDGGSFNGCNQFFKKYTQSLSLTNFSHPLFICTNFCSKEFQVMVWVWQYVQCHYQLKIWIERRV